MTDAPLIAHSLAEAHCYLMVTPCGACGKGPLAGSEDRNAATPQESDDQGDNVTRPADDPPCVLTINAACQSCGHRADLRFQLPSPAGSSVQASGPNINPANEPSRMIDVAQWITLFRVITASAAEASDKSESRRLGLEAALCLEEALKFYDDPDNAVPPPEAFFHEASRERFKRNPEQFAKQRLIELRAKLPSEAVMRSRLDSARGKKRRWWRRSQ